MFRSCANKGFQMDFPNGTMISIQFGPGNYCENREAEFNSPQTKIVWESKNAEVAIFLPDGSLYDITEYDTVEGWQTVTDVCKWIELAQKLDTNYEGVNHSD